MLEFGTDLSITYVMGGLAREFGDPTSMIVPWLWRGAAQAAGATPSGAALPDPLAAGSAVRMPGNRVGRVSLRPAAHSRV